MDLSLKQRLLGAAVLIALAVIVVPMIMSGTPPRKTAELETSSLAIPPAPDREFQQRVLPVDATPANAKPATPTAPSPDAVTPVDTAVPPKVQAPEPAPVTVAPSPVTTTKTDTAPERQPAAEVVKPLPGRAANGHFFVHLGLYADTGNADDLVAALKKQGFPAFAETSSYQGKPAARVRVGPFDDRAGAEASRLRIKQIKPAVPGSVVELAGDAKADAPASALASKRAGGWAVQLGALKSIDDANKLRDRLKNAGYAAFVDKVDANGTVLWRVRAGPEVDRAEADRMRTGIREKLKLDGIIVTL
jgi:DedD protein